MFGSIFLSILGISLLIFVHETGHFLVARAAGVRVEVFSLGFGNRLWGFNWRGTDFRISMVPFGGYVMVAGADPSDRRYPARESLYAKSAGRRALFWSGGVIMNLLFAVIVFPLVFHAGVPFTAPVVGEVVVGGAAWEAGIEPGDRILTVGDHEVLSFENLHMQVALGGKRATSVRVQRPDGSQRTLSVTPHWNGEDGLYGLGVGSAGRDVPLHLTVDQDGPAARAGIATGDLLLRVNGVSTVGATLRDALDQLDQASDHAVALDLRRDEREFTVHLQAELLKKPAPALLGIRALPRVVVGLRQDDPLLARLGLLHDDVLLAIDGAPFLAGSLDVAADGPPELSLTVLRAGQRLTLRQPVTPAERKSLATVVALGPDDSLMLLPQPDGAAAAAGLRAGDRLATLDGDAVRSFKALAKIVHAAADEPMQLHLLRWDTSAPEELSTATGDLTLTAAVDLSVRPRRAPVHSLGFAPHREELNETVRGESVGDSIRLGVTCSIDMVKQIYVTLKRLVTGEVGSNNLGGIIRMGTVSYQAAQRGMAWFWYFLAMLSVNLAIVNLLPIPVLDGGHLLFVLIEKVKGSPVSARVHGYSQVVGLVFVLMLVLFVTYNDILWLL